VNGAYKTEVPQKGPVVLVVLDGWGVNPEKRGNAILAARTPNYDMLMSRYPHSQLIASGTAVGLPPDLMGNSEVGHLTIGAGRVVIQKLTIISKAIADGTFFENPVLLRAVGAAKQGTLHIVGLLSDGCVHSSLDHLDALIELARRHDLPNVVIHPLLDGRDTPPRSALNFVRELQSKLRIGEQIGVVCGRYYGMDRDNRWERVEKYWRALVLSEGKNVSSAQAGVQEAYDAGLSDEFIEPLIVNDHPIKDGDSVICFNFRPDRVRQITRALTQSHFDQFIRPRFPKVFYACLTEYDESLDLPVAFDAATMQTPKIEHTLPEILACHHIGQFHTAETEKYAHVTYFLNGGKEAAEEGETRKLIPSLKVATYDLAPQMQTAQVCDSACQAIVSGNYPFIVLNFANPDMVGHTGMLSKAVEAIESVDSAFAKLLEAIQAAKGTLLITADHGNCEQMINYATGEPHTAHTTNPVPFIVANFQNLDPLGLKNGATLENGSLADVAPTILQIMGLHQPADMDGKSLIIS
jgi:2,3-bisphosphoglycerate-independent phosphoglycerate mutase